MTTQEPAVPSSSSSSSLLRWNWKGLALVIVTPMLGGFLYGFDIGATSFVLSKLILHKISALQQGMLVSAVSLGALLGSHLVFLSHSIGRRMELRVSATLYLVGNLCNVLSGTWWNSLIMLFVGRFIFGIGVGFTMHGAPAYMAEMCPPEIRGAVVSAKETVIVAGIVIGYATGNSLPSSEWTDLYALSTMVALPMLLLTFCIPRSKRWLLLHGYRDEAKEAMRFIYTGEEIEKEFFKLEVQLGLDRTPSSLPLGEWNLNDYRPALVASMGLIVFQQFSGQPSVLSYTTILFQAAGWSGNASVITSLFMMGASMTTVALVDRVGRKRLLYACCAIMMTASFTLSICFWNETLSTTSKGIVFVAMFIYIGGYQVGFGPITWCIVSEVFPLEVRGKAIALGVELNYALNFSVQLLFPLLRESLGFGRSFALFGIGLGLCILFVHDKVPETKGLTLEEIQVLLSTKQSPHKSHSFTRQDNPRETIDEESSLLPPALELSA